jgi:hypothetical protein
MAGVPSTADKFGDRQYGRVVPKPEKLKESKCFPLTTPCGSKHSTSGQGDMPIGGRCH